MREASNLTIKNYRQRTYEKVVDYVITSCKYNDILYGASKNRKSRV